MKLNIPVYCHNHAFDPALDWNLNAEFANARKVYQQPFKIALLPAHCTDPNNFSYTENFPDLHLNEFNLIIVSDIESSTPTEMWDWAQRFYADSVKAAVGSLTNKQPLDLQHMVYRPWWMYNLLRMNQYQDVGTDNKLFMFDALLGARKPHRDFVMYCMQKHDRLRDQCLLSYRDIFHSGTVIDSISQQIKQNFLQYELEWPFVSNNIDPQWEVKQQLDKSISPFVPWELYKRSWYSIVCETNSVGDRLFLTEKTTKPMFAKRLFVMFSTANFLQNLRDLGFETFGCVIDESYDYQQHDIVRWQQAFDQVLSLSQQDPVKVYRKIKPILEHNYNRMFELQQETQTQMQKILEDAIPEQYVVKT